MRITVTVRGDLEKYIENEINKAGLTPSMILLNLATSGWEYKEGLQSLVKLASALPVNDIAKTE